MKRDCTRESSREVTREEVAGWEVAMEVAKEEVATGEVTGEEVTGEEVATREVAKEEVATREATAKGVGWHCRGSRLGKKRESEALIKTDKFYPTTSKQKF